MRNGRPDNRQWIKQTLAHHEPESVPFNISLSPLPRAALERHYGVTDVEAALDFPIRMSGTKTIKPIYASPAVYGPTLRDEFGVGWSTNEIDRGAPIGPCLPEPDLRGYRFPDPAAQYRFEELGSWCAHNREHFIVLWVGDLWERATFMRGMESLLLDLILHPQFVEELLRGIADYILATMQILFARFEFDAIALSDDYGTQRALVMAPELWRRFLKPLLREIYSLAHRHERFTLHHSCGNNNAIVADLIEIGLDILHPIQPEAMDVVALKREFGRELTLCGGLRTQDLLPHASAEAVRAEVRRLKQVLGRGGGYILEPGITLQADIPVENIVAIIEEARAG